MSLINDALKKAQKQRTGEAPALGSMPSIGGEAPRQIARRGKSSGPQAATIAGGITAAVLLIGGGAWFLLQDTSAPTTASATSSLQPAAPSPAASAPPPSAPAPKTPAEAPRRPAHEGSFTLPIAAATPPPLPSPSQPPPTETIPAGPNQAPSSTPPAPAPARQLEPRAIQYIEALKVGAIMARSASDAKVLMNDRVYRIGSLVEPEMGLRLVGITANSLTFEDAHGGHYTRTF